MSNAKVLGKLEECARLYADKNLLQPRFDKIAADKKIYFDKLRHQVKLRLENEIRFWDNLATEHACKNDKLNSDLAMRRADEAEERLKIRLAEIDRDKNISAQTPKIIGSALIVPRTFSDNADARSVIEKIAMNAVMNIERELGNSPNDISKENRGYDIESATPNGQMRFIEVKGRVADADTVTISKNEIITALNCAQNFILAIVRIANDKIAVTYLQTPFKNTPDLATVSINYKISALIRQGKLLLKSNQTVDAP